jgi:ABC-type Mn2+/Zn2+ transport system permease subunit
VDWLIEPFSVGLIQRALVAGALTVVTTSLVGTWVVLRGMTFMGDALAHGVVPGIAVAFLLGIDLALGAAVSAGLMVVGIDVVGRRSRLPHDTSIGLMFVGMLALGVIIISLRGAYAGDLTAILFGDVVGVTVADVWRTGVAAVVAAVLILLGYRPFLVLAFSEDKADVLGLRPGFAHVAMLGLVALAVVASFRTVGSLLVFAFLIAPPATASLLVRRVPAMMLAAIALGWLAVAVGLVVSYHADTAAAPTIAFVSVLEFFAVLVWRELAERARGARPAPA